MDFVLKRRHRVPKGFWVFCTLVFTSAVSGASDPSAKDLVNLVLRSGESPLPQSQSSGCQMEDLGKQPKIRSYLAFLLATLAEAGKTDLQKVRAVCTDSKKTGRRQCELGFRVSDPAGESPWDYGLRFEVVKKGTEIDLKTVACFGAG